MLNNRFFEIDHFVTGLKNAITFTNNTIFFNQEGGIHTERWEHVREVYRPAERKGREVHIHTATVETSSRFNVFWKLDDDEKLSVSFLKDGCIVTMFEHGVFGDVSCGSI